MATRWWLLPALGTAALATVGAWEAELRPCGDDARCAPARACVAGLCWRRVVPALEPRRLPPRPVALPATARPGCGDGVCDLAAGECEALCGADCPGVPCEVPCRLDGVCELHEGGRCPDCNPAPCNFDELCSIGESPRCPDCSCGDGVCDEDAGECAGTCPGDCPRTPCARVCDFDGACEEDEAAGCPDCTCGDGVCEPGREDCGVCPLDCGGCAMRCGDGLCEPGEGPSCDDCRPERSGRP